MQSSPRKMLLLNLVSLLSTLLLLVAVAQPLTAKELYVKPTNDTCCPAEPCHTLDEYVQNATRYFVSNTTFNFLSGNHNLSQSLNVIGASNLALVAINHSANVTCQHRDKLSKLLLSFTEISNLRLEDLTLSSQCTSLYFLDVLNFNLLNCYIGSVHINFTNIFGSSTLARVSVAPQRQNSTQTMVLVQYNDHSSLSYPTHNQIAIKDCRFSSIDVTNLELSHANYTVDLIMKNVEGSVHTFNVTVFSNASNNVMILNLNFPRVSLYIRDYSKESNTSVYIANSELLTSVFTFTLTSIRLRVEDSLFQHGTGTIQELSPGISFCTLKNVTFSILQGISMYAQPLGAILGAVTLKNVTGIDFIECTFTSNNGHGTLFGGNSAPVILMISCEDINFTSCTFSNNTGSVMSAINSNFILSGSNSFSNNAAYRGGAMAFYGSSYVTLSNHSNTTFMNNSALTTGGVFYVDYVVLNLCFLKFEGAYSCTGRTDTPVPTIHLSFGNNTAKNGGNRVYGASLDECAIEGHSCEGWNFASSVLHANQWSGSDVTTITSSPLRACLCKNGRPSCTSVFNNQTLYAGATFHIPAVVVGDRFGAVDGSVYTQIVPLRNTGEMAALDNLQISQDVDHSKCTSLSYTIFSNSSAVTLALTASNTPVEGYPYDLKTWIKFESSLYLSSGVIWGLLRSFPVYINITLLPCPLGFVLSGEPPQYKCELKLQKNNIPCNLTTQTIQRSGTEWVNASFKNNTSNGVILNMYCPNNYCKSQTLNVNLDFPDTQCAFNHSGTLCGGCDTGLSLALGSIKCLACSNEYLLLIIPFAIAGLALVFFIKLLDLTVAAGTLNGLILYANIFRANQSTLIPEQGVNILTIFIAWLNLDLGIETCFFNGLNGYWKTWLQFVFPLYIWTIAAVIITLSRYSSTAARIFGRNSVQVLATLFLLSYSKLLRTVISIFHTSTLDYPDRTTATLWSYDANITYLSTMHVPLFVSALVITLFLWLPYTGILFFAQFLQKLQNKKLTNALVKLKPFLDAYFGPLKDRHRYWVGLMLLVRGMLFVCFSATPESHSEVDLLVTLAVVLFLLMYQAYVGQIYRKNYISLLESSFLVNLGTLSGSTLYVRSVGRREPAFAYASCGIALVLFAIITAGHAIIAVKHLKICLAGRFQRVPTEPPEMLHAHSDNEHEGYIDEPATVVVNRQRVKGIVIEAKYDEYREPVLKYLDPET